MSTIDKLKLSDNSKVKFKKRHYNTFGLTHGLPENGGTCPGATHGKGGCLDTRDGLKRKTCYVEKLVQIYPAFSKLLKDNTEILANKSLLELQAICENTIQTFIHQSKNKDLSFRLHMSGDFFSEDYTKAWVNIIKAHPEINFWVYTRSIEYVPYLVGIKNLTLYLSCDPDNMESMTKLFNTYKDEHPNIGLAWLGTNAPAPEEFRWVKCPEVTGKIKNTEDQGACSKCRLCVNNYKVRVKNIEFPYH